jgi:hypothetical protein
VRARGIRPQPGQDRCPGQLTRPARHRPAWAPGHRTHDHDFFRSK